MPLKEVHSVAELRAHYREVAARMRAAVTAHAPPPRPPQPEPQPAPRPKLTPIQRIIAAVAIQFNVPVFLIVSPLRRADIMVARSVAIYLVTELTGYSPPAIGAAFGNRDPHTVRSALNSIRRKMAGDAALARTIELLHARLLEQQDD